MAKLAMFTLFSGSSSMMERTRRRSVSPGYLSITACHSNAERTAMQEKEEKKVFKKWRRPWELVSHFQVPGVDFVNDLQVAREDMLEHAHWPALQGFREEGVVGISEGPGADVPRFVPTEMFLVHEETHQLRDGHGWVSVIQLDSSLGTI